MRLTRLASAGFRNLAGFELVTDAQFVVFHGPNGQGKTNALEAIHWLAALKPLRGSKPREMIRWGADEALVTGDVSAGGIRRRYRVGLTGGARKAEVDGHAPRDLDDYFEGVRVIAFTPADAEIATGEPARRRSWLDRAAFTWAPHHLGLVRTVRRILDQKSAALQHGAPDHALLDALDVQLATAGARLIDRRADALDALLPHAQAVHAEIAGGVGEVSFRYRTHGAGQDFAARQAALAEKLVAHRAAELRRRMPLVGPQTDEVVLQLDGQPVRAFASRGQVRSLVLALKLAELLVARARGDVPLFLLDDVSSELDRARTGRLVGALAALGAQVFATTTEREHLGQLPLGDTLEVDVDAGVLTPRA